MSYYQLHIEDITLLADALTELDGPSATPHQRQLVERGHLALMRALGTDTPLVYGLDDEIVLSQGSAA